MEDDELHEGLHDEGISESWTLRYMKLLAYVRQQRDAAIAFAEGHRPVVAPHRPVHYAEADLEAHERLTELLGRQGSE